MREVLVGLGSCGLAAGGLKVYQRFAEILDPDGKDAVLKKTGCIGMCHAEVLVEVKDGDGGSTFYRNVTPDRVERIIEEHLRNGRVVADWVLDAGAAQSKQRRVALRNSGIIDPDNLDEYLAHAGYQALEKAVTRMTPDEVIQTIADSGLRGRGGAGFPTGTKWRFAADSKDTHKYVICNADEGDPGAFMDRSLLESDPHSILEGMALAAYAIGADAGYIYVRAEYPEAVKRLKRAIAQATDRGLLGGNILGKGFDFHIRLKEGAGAFVCGEETALIASIEGKRGMPRVRPPFPVESGLWGHPTCINNVETLANVAWIILNGAAAFNSLGTEGSKGTKVFALAGKVKHGGLVEVPMGMTINEVIYDIGGGTLSGGPFKAVQMGGPSGGCIPAALGATPIDYEHITATGAIIGSGGMVVMDETTCMVDVARFFLSFTQNESCGKCTFCRVGTKRMLEILDRICAGKGKDEDIALLSELGEQIKSSSLCGLGQSAPNPVLTTLRYFLDEYHAHIRDHKCPAKSCLALVEFAIIPEKCIGCGLCIAACAVGAITGEKKQPHTIEDAKCIRCGKCITVCNVGAIEKR
ncbi:MAG: NADH-quinone oxidoreductase subunit NuoF [Acidobacteria bacterium]|jgi:NADH-quinone oxidoreductase subunit F|nr:NADH-quinone oxidoreductase subunit NuoF [Acidobacteriota bacterium]